MKLPANVGQKKSKGIEQMLQEMGLGKLQNIIFVYHVNPNYFNFRIKSNPYGRDMSTFQ